MNNLKRKVLKGFTLIELIVVMAVFSILLVGVMALIDPVSEIYSSATIGDKTYSISNNAEVYIQSRLEYADALWVMTGDKIESATLRSNRRLADGADPADPTAYVVALNDGIPGITSGDFDKIAYQFWYEYYKDLVKPLNTANLNNPDPTNYTGISGNIYVMRLVNQGDGTFKKGQITQRSYPFNTLTGVGAATAETAQLNPAYFDASDAVYELQYALGASELITLDNSTDYATVQGMDGRHEDDESYRVLASDYSNDPVTVTYNNLSLSIVVDRLKQKNDGTPVHFDFTTAAGVNCRAYKPPCAFSVANIPLLNISAGGGTLTRRIVYGQADLTDPTSTKIHRIDYGAFTPVTFNKDNINLNVDFSSDIYFVYAYADELQ